MRIAKLVSGFFLAVAVCLLLFSQSAQAGCGFLPDGDYVCGGSGVGNGSGGGVFAPEAAPGTTLIAPDGTPLMDILGEGGAAPASAATPEYAYEEALEAFDKVEDAISKLPPYLQDNALGVFDSMSIEEIVASSKGEVAKEDECHKVYFLGEYIGKKASGYDDYGCVTDTSSYLDGGGFK